MSSGRDVSTSENRPVILISTGRNEVTAVRVASESEPGWQDVAERFTDTLSPVLRKLGADMKTQKVSMRTFTMPNSDLAAWDNLEKIAAGNGFSYATVRDPAGHFAKNLSLKEVSQVATSVPIDPMTIATYAAVRQMQTQIEQLTDMVEQLQAKVDQVLDRMNAKQQAEILSAFDTIDEVHYRVRDWSNSVPSVDWDRIAPLEQVLKTQMREVISELGRTADTLAFADLKSAKAALHIDADRVRDLITLGAYTLRALTEYLDLMLRVKDDRGELTAADIENSRATLSEYRNHFQSAANRILAADSTPSKRDWFTRLATNGILVGGAKDQQAIDSALKVRTAAKQTVTGAMGTWLSIDDRPAPAPATMPGKASQLPDGVAAENQH